MTSGATWCLIQITFVFLIPCQSGTGGPNNTWVPTCPISCGCTRRFSRLSKTHMKTVDCSNVGIRHLPVNISLDTEAFLLARNRFRLSAISNLGRFVNLSLLDLAGNGIYSLEGTRIFHPSVKYLRIDRNEIDYLPNRSFAGLPHLTLLSLSFNSIEIINGDAFVGLSVLKTLDLSHNRVFTVKAQWFRSLASLQVLNLRENNIYVLRDGVFKYLHQLTHLVISSNRLKHIYDGAFSGLHALKHLDVETNHIRTIPSQALQGLSCVDTITLSNNHIMRLEPFSFMNVNVSVLKLNNMRDLTLVDNHAFVNMPYLVRLEMFNGKAMRYIDRDAFQRVPKLQALSVHGNNLSAVEEAVLSEMPSISWLSLYDNPLVCDCNVYWIKEAMGRHTRNITFVNPNQIICTSPASRKGKSINSRKIRGLPRSCAPRILPLYEAEYNQVLGDKVRFDCRAVGIPKPQINWLLPSHTGRSKVEHVQVVKSGTKADPKGHIVVTSEGSLFIDYIEATDHGQYTCLASNPRGRDERLLHIHVKNMRANVIIIRVAADSVTVTWTSTRHSYDYRILYRRSNSNHTYRIIDIKPYMRTYTASELTPETNYEFCIAVKHGAKSVKINCTKISTRHSSYMRLGVISARDYIIGIGVGCSGTTFALICTVTYFVKRYNRRKRQQEELYGDNMSQLFMASIDSLSDTTPITYENRAAEIFDDDDIAEIRSAAASASASTSGKYMSRD